MGKTLYVSDLDGTLLDNSARLSRNTTDILNRLLAEGLMFTCATSRSFGTAGAMTKELNLSLPVASYNGVFLTEPQSGRVIESCLLEKERLEGLFGLIRQREMTPLVYSLIDGRERVSWLFGRETPELQNYLEARKKDPRMRAASGYDELFEGDTFYLTFINPGESLYPLQNLLDGNLHFAYNLQEDTYSESELWLEIFRHDATKRHSIRRLKELAGADEIVCFGDNINDIPMFLEADRGYAVANACRGIKDLATGIIGENTADGVAKWLQENFKQP